MGTPASAIRQEKREGTEIRKKDNTLENPREPTGQPLELTGAEQVAGDSPKVMRHER